MHCTEGHPGQPSNSSKQCPKFQALTLTHRGEFLDDVVALSEGGEPDLLRELCERRVGEEGHVADELVHHVRLGRVHRLRGVPLGGQKKKRGFIVDGLPFREGSTCSLGRQVVIQFW